MMLPPSSISDDVVQSPLMSAEGNLVTLFIVYKYFWVCKGTKTFADPKMIYAYLPCMIDFADDFPLAILFSQGEQVIVRTEFTER